MSRNKTPKSILYELIVINMCPHTPIFATSRVGGVPHSPIYESTVTIMGWKMGVSKTIPTLCGQGTGRSKKLAEHEAAVAALLELKKVNGLAWPDIYLSPKTSSTPLFMPVFTHPQPQPQTALMLLEAGPAGVNGHAEFARMFGRSTDVC